MEEKANLSERLSDPTRIGHVRCVADSFTEPKRSAKANRYYILRGIVATILEIWLFAGQFVYWVAWIIGAAIYSDMVYGIDVGVSSFIIWAAMFFLLERMETKLEKLANK